MRPLPLLVSALLVASASAQVDDDVVTVNIPIEDLGTLNLVDGTITPPNQIHALFANNGVIFAHTCLAYATAPCNIVFLNNLVPGEIRVDDGRIPSTSSPSPYVGAMNTYRITSFQIGYCTDEDDPTIGGPGANITVMFWQDYDGCVNLNTAGTPTAQFNLNLPGTLTTGTTRCVNMNINLVGGLEFNMLADADGVNQGSATQDKFGYGFQTTNVTTGKTNSIIRAGQPAGNTNACVIGDGTYYQNPSATGGNGLANNNNYWVQTGANGVCFAGNATQSNCPAQPGPVFGGYYMSISADLTDCNANFLPDVDDIASGTSLDLNGNGVPDECDPAAPPTSYCTCGTTTNGCCAAITANNNPSVTFANPCQLSVGNIEGQKSGIIFYGLSQQALPWAAGSSSFLCVKLPTARTLAQNSGGTFSACNGSLALDWNAFQQANPNSLGNPWSVGRFVFVQAWFRDPPAPKTTNLSDGVMLTYLP